MAKKTTGRPEFKVVERRSGEGKVERYEQPGQDVAGFWWNAKDGDAHGAVWGAVDRVLAQQERRRQASQTFERLYGDEAPIGKDTDDRVTMNIIRMAVDTLCAKISKQKPKTAFVTDGGDWAQQRRAKRTEKWVDGWIYRAKANVLARDEFRDAAVKDAGFEKWFLRDNEIVAERVLPEQILVDVVDGQFGAPRCLYQVMPVHREVLRAQFKGSPELLEALKKADAPRDAHGMDAITPDALGDMVEVREAWHLPSAKGAKDGRHVIAISSATLLDEPWTRDDFPFVVTYFSKKLRGFYGAGVAEQLVRWQRSVNKKLRRMNQCLDRMAVPRIFVDELSEVNARHLANGEVGDIVKYRGQPPTFPPVAAVPPELFKSIEDDVRHALESVGVSMMDVAARKPGGIDSKVAMREWSDIASERFILAAQAFEETFVARTRQVLALSQEAAEKGAKLTTMVEGRNGMERLDWSEVAMDEEQFILKALPTSSLPSTPAARKQTISEWLEMGWIDGLTARRLMDMPDLEAANTIAFAGQEDIEWTLEDLLDGKEYETPEPYQDLAYGLKRFQSAYLRARRQKAPEEILQRLRDWMSQAEGLLPPPAPAAPPALPAGPAMPPPVAA